LAHFLEHLLFMGSIAYPDEKTFTDFISTAGGEDNAYTGEEETVYTFDCRPRKLEEAMEMFGAFLESPLLKFESAAREIKAIDSEFQSAKQKDESRRMELLSGLVGGGHGARFPTEIYTRGCHWIPRMFA
jgi:nardilysin